MEPAHLLVHAAAAVADRGDEDLAREQMAAAEAALAVAAVGVDRDARALERDGDRLGGLRAGSVETSAGLFTTSWRKRRTGTDISSSAFLTKRNIGSGPQNM